MKLKVLVLVFLLSVLWVLTCEDTPPEELCPGVAFRATEAEVRAAFAERGLELISPGRDRSGAVVPDSLEWNPASILGYDGSLRVDLYRGHANACYFTTDEIEGFVDALSRELDVPRDWLVDMGYSEGPVWTSVFLPEKFVVWDHDDSG